MTSALEHKRVLVLYAGGVRFAQAFTPARAQSILNQYLDLQLVADTTVEIVDHVSGINANWGLAGKVAETIFVHYKDYDGFVVLHSIDNVVWISNLVQFLLEKLGKPIVFTGTPLAGVTTNAATAPVSAVEQEMSLRTNLITAVQLATMNCRGVLLAYGNQVYRAVRAMMALPAEKDYFSANEVPAAEVQFGLQLHAKIPVRQEHYSVKWIEQFSPNIAVLHTLPDVQQLALLPASCQAVILPSFQQWSANELAEFAKRFSGIIILYNYVNEYTLPTNVIGLPNIALPALLAKTMVGLGQTDSVEALGEYLTTNQVNEFTSLL